MTEPKGSSTTYSYIRTSRNNSTVVRQGFNFVHEKMSLAMLSAAAILLLLVLPRCHAWPRNANVQISSRDAVIVEERVLLLCEGREIHKKCESSNCGEESCRQLLGTQPKKPNCNKDCVTGCFCRSGFYRHHNDTCVTATECRKS
nr:uncharacterized protein LOC126534859 [Dermacentor andersoni]